MVRHVTSYQHPRTATEILREELQGLRLTPGDFPDVRRPKAAIYGLVRPTSIHNALQAAGDLLDVPREKWAVPATDWQRLVVALATAVRRCQGALNLNRRQATVMTRGAAEHLVSYARQGEELDEQVSRRT